MTKKLRIVLAQLNLTVGDIQGNLQQLMTATKTARDTLHADMIVFPELAMTGYPPEDLLLHPAFLQEAKEATNTLLQFTSQIKGIYVVVGHPAQTTQGLFNACSVMHEGHLIAGYSKHHLPNTGIFDECRYFTPGTGTCLISVHGVSIRIVICEDLWHPLVDTRGQLILSLNASPFEINKHTERQAMLARQAKHLHAPILYVNGVSGQDELIFDGGSMAVDATGTLCQHAGFFNPTLLPIDLDVTKHTCHLEKQNVTLPDEESRIYQALVLGVRDYVNKNQIPAVYVGVSGGIDSALTLAIAVDALGKDRVTALLLPSRYTNNMSIEDGIALCQQLAVVHEIISIEPTFTAFLTTLAPHLTNKEDITTQNLQARCRGVILMALANQSGRIVLTTGNRSELAVGYTTLYGDMAGGFAVLKDIPKTLVYRLAHYRNQQGSVIPERIMTRPPTAELAPNQTDQDTLPPYDILDAILEYYLNQRCSIEEITAKGFDHATVTNIVRMIKLNEYKRRQAPLGVRINHTAFGKDRRYPITARFIEK